MPSKRSDIYREAFAQVEKGKQLLKENQKAQANIETLHGDLVKVKSAQAELEAELARLKAERDRTVDLQLRLLREFEKWRDNTVKTLEPLRDRLSGSNPLSRSDSIRWADKLRDVVYYAPVALGPTTKSGPVLIVHGDTEKKAQEDD